MSLQLSLRGREESGAMHGLVATSFEVLYVDITFHVYRGQLTISTGRCYGHGLAVNR